MTDTKDMVRERSTAPDTAEPALPIARRSEGLGAVVERLRAVRSARRIRDAKTALEQVGGGDGPARVRARTVVVVDDEPEQLETTVMVLESAGHRVIGSADGAGAVALVAAEDAEVVVLDFMLKDITGGDVCAALRAQPDLRRVRIVVLSGTPEAFIRRSCTGYDVYLSKPARPAALLAALEPA